MRPPRVIYVGALRSWFDHEVVRFWARELPDVEFVVFGPNDAGISTELPNLEFPGAVDPWDVPTILSGARFGIIPFKENQLTRAAHPLKLYEYLAAGCQVLSSRIPEVRDIPGVVFTYENAGDGLEILQKHLFSSVRRKLIRELAEEQSWSQRVDDVSERLGIQV